MVDTPEAFTAQHLAKLLADAREELPYETDITLLHYWWDN
jgi:hypothetical protein